MKIKHKAFIISLPQAIRRRKAISFCLKRLGIDYTFIEGVNGDNTELVESLYTCDYHIKERLYKKERTISKREIACTLSHIKAIKCAYLENLDFAWILEDDAEFICTERNIVDSLISIAPRNAAFLQFQTMPASTVDSLFKIYKEFGSIFQKKEKDPSTSFANPLLHKVNCHGATAYLISKAGINNVMNYCTQDGRFLFPCTKDESLTNIKLLADRFIYWAASSDNYPGFTVNIPLVTTTATDSHLHSSHIPGHQDTRSVAIQHYQDFMENSNYSS